MSFNRYIKNFPTITEESFHLIKNKQIAIVGAGGTGGYVLEMLARFGIGYIKLIDGDRFDETNLNRQILSSESNLLEAKTDSALRRVKAINSDVELETVHEHLREENAWALLQGSDLVFDAVDNIPARFLIQSACNQLNIPFIHSAVGGWVAQICAIFPGDNSLDKIYPDPCEVKDDQRTTVSFMPALAASIQVAQGIKVLLNMNIGNKQMIYFNLLLNQYKIIDLSD